MAAGEREGKVRVPHLVAAGGLLERTAGDGIRIALVHRQRYADRDGSAGDWVLPKGKREPGESLEQAAYREVEEETGCRGRIRGPGYPIEYRVDGVPKLVTYFRMECEAEGAPLDRSEVAEVCWLSPHEAIARLTYQSERDVVRRAHPGVVGRRDDSP